jgi:chromosome partitioning protein
MPKVITVIGQNPEIGKTTTVINLAAWISLLGKKVLILDLEPGGDAAFMIGAHNSKRHIDLQEVILEQLPLDMAILNTSVKDLFIVPAFNEGLESLFFDIFDENLFVLRDIIDLLETEFDYIFLDVPDLSVNISKAALVASDSVIIALKCEATQLDSIPPLIDTIIEVKENFNQWIELQGILITLFSEASDSRQLIMRAKERFGELMFKTVIHRNIKIAEANNAGCPVALHDMKSFGSESYLRLAREFMQHHEINV